MAETQYDAGTSPSIDIGGSVEANNSPVEEWQDSGYLWGLGYQVLTGEILTPSRTWPAMKRSIP